MLHAAASASRFIYHDQKAALIMLRMAGWVLFVSLGAKVLSLHRLLGIVTPAQRPLSNSLPKRTEAETSHLIDALHRVNLFVFKPICWKRAIVLHRYLRLSGIQTRVVFGVRRRDDQFLAGHAWVEAGNKPLLEAETPDYVVTYSFPDGSQDPRQSNQVAKRL